MSKIYQYIQLLPNQGRGDDFVIKRASARDLVLCLPQPENIQREPHLIPDVPVKLVLSTTDRLPSFIKDIISKSQDKEIFGDETLGGLCLNGREMPMEIFLHDVLLNKKDPSGKMFEEIFWHEYVHGAEGIFFNLDGCYERETPWSFIIQNKMLKMDQDVGHDPFKKTTLPQDLRTLMEYFRKGTDLQQNVSEIFARAACAYMLTIRDAKLAPEFGETSLLVSGKLGSKISSDLKRNLRELFAGLGTYSPQAQDKFFEEMPMMMARIHVLYGLAIPK